MRPFHTGRSKGRPKGGVPPSTRWDWDRTRTSSVVQTLRTVRVNPTSPVPLPLLRSIQVRWLLVTRPCSLLFPPLFCPLLTTTFNRHGTPSSRREYSWRGARRGPVTGGETGVVPSTGISDPTDPRSLPGPIPTVDCEIPSGSSLSSHPTSLCQPPPPEESYLTPTPVKVSVPVTSPGTPNRLVEDVVSRSSDHTRPEFLVFLSPVKKYVPFSESGSYSENLLRSMSGGRGSNDAA